MASDIHFAVSSALQRDGQRYTRGRRAIVEILDGAERPLTIPEILGRGRSLAQSSVYRNLAVLEGAGSVHRVVTSDEHARYELAEALHEHHHHLICATCGRVDDYRIPPRVEHMLTQATVEIGRENGFGATHHRLDLIGTCRGCS